MSNNFSCPVLVAQLFPNRANELARLARSSEHFRSLCEDYELAIGTLRQLEIQGRPQDATRVTEYRCLIVELERELSEIVEGKK